ncbi:hypothetical protein PRIPAC_76252 [Pristionchus pacificus]|nr:hypothetical protein PRIPAC_76252 [Pristionchus pacificus]
MEANVRWLLLTLVTLRASFCSPLSNCPMSSIRQIVQRAALAAKDPATQMQMIRRILEDVNGGTWGVLIVRDPMLVSQEVHWTIPDHVNPDGTPAFCLTVTRGWQYNVFKTGTEDIPDRVTIEDFISKMRHSDVRQTSKTSPTKLTVTEFDARLAQAIDRERKRRKTATKRKEMLSIINGGKDSIEKT